MRAIRIPRLRLLVFGIGWILFTITLEFINQIVVQIVIDNVSNDYPYLPYAPSFLHAVYETTGTLGVTIINLWLSRGVFYGVGVIIILYWCYAVIRQFNEVR
ncbi:MAG: hypothetical protein ACFFCT_02020 [Candidatus Odinarchaeota archaeon]